MSESHTLGKFCSVAKKGTIIMPKIIPGYIAPEGQILEEDGQKINFVYTPEEYNINYILDGGITSSVLKETFTCEDEDYIPEFPTKVGYMFNGWEPKSIPHGTIGDVTFVATWITDAVLMPGRRLNEAFIGLAGGKDNIVGFKLGDHKPDDSFNISSTSTPILASFDEADGSISLYCKYTIICNADMSGMCKDFTMLNDISCFKWITCNPNTVIDNIFDGCRMLANVEGVNNWADGKFSSFIDAFKDTAAFASNRTPAWYRWNEKIIHTSSTGKVIDSFDRECVPGDTIYPKSYQGYKAATDKIIIQSPEAENVFVYVPNEYSIEYVLNGGELLNAKTHYTIEDETYYPPEPVKPGYKFIGWDRECITSGETGNVVFIAHYNSI